MHISNVSLVNYRNFKNAKFELKKGINTIIGENGSGKTNLFRAMRLLLEDSSIQYAYKLNDSDFNRTLGENGWKGHWIIISIEFDEICDNEAIQALFIHGFGEVTADCIKKANYNLFFRPKADIRQKLSELKSGDHAALKALLDTITVKDNYEVFFTGKSTADFNDPNTYKELVGDFESVSFPSAIDASKFGAKIPHQLSVSKEISFTFIQALRDVVSDFHNNRTNPLLGLLKSKSGAIAPSAFQPINDLVLKLNDEIESLEDVQEIRTDIQNTIRDAVGQTYSPSSLSIKSSVPDQADKLLQSLKLFIGEPDESYEGGIHELSLGGANLIFLTLKLLEFKYQKAKDTFANFLIIEEPEAHIHTHIQKTLFDKLDYSDTQIIYSTHSTHISEVSNVENINILAKRMNYAEVYQPAQGLEPNGIQQIQRYLDAVRTNLLFAKGVILVEGDAEEILIPIMVKKVYGVSLDELGISLINIRSTGFENVAQLFHDDRIHRRCSILTDLDDAICDTTPDSSDKERIKKYKKRVVQSQQSGIERKVRLDSLALDNSWLEVFYATHTFEVDFTICGNQYEVIETLNEVYKDPKTIETAKDEINSEDVALSGKRVLTIAKNMGKGWFAILLGEHINELTYIPDYILKGLIHSKEEWPPTLISTIISYRLNYLQSHSDYSETEFKPLFHQLSIYKSGAISLKDYATTISSLGDKSLSCFVKELIV